MDVRLWSKELISDFISLYKSFPCLWKCKSEEYKSKRLRESALNSVADLCKSRGFPEANKDFVSKKIQSLRGSFRKELKKKIDSERNGHEYVPSLWYFDLLLFTKDQELPTPGDISSLDTAEDKEGDVNYTKTSHDDLTEVKDGLEEEEEISQEILGLQHRPQVRLKRRKVSDWNSSQGLIELCASALHASSRPLSEYEAVGVNLSSKLAKMEPSQAIFAESLVSSVIRQGLLNKLTENTSLCESCCNYNKGGILWTSSHPSMPLPSAAATSLQEEHSGGFWYIGDRNVLYLETACAAIRLETETTFRFNNIEPWLLSAYLQKLA